MTFLAENWYILVAIVAVVAAGIIALSRIHLKKVREWLLYAVTMAEKELGSGTGKLKLRTVYDMFVERYKWISIFISFEQFSKLVDDALVEMREILSNNHAITAYVNN